MSLVGTLAKVAIGVALAKGMQAVSERSKTAGAGNPGTGGLFGGVNSPKQAGQTGLEDMMGNILGGRARDTSGSAAQTAQTGGLGGLLDQFSNESGGIGGGGGQSAQPGGSLGDLLGGLLGGAAGGAGSGGLGDLLGGLLGGAAAGGAATGGAADPIANKTAKHNDKSFGEVLNTSFANKGEPDVTPTDEQNAIAALMLRAMIQAAKADGSVDDAEKQKLLGNLGEVSREEMAFVQAELKKQVDVDGLARQVPHGMQKQVYTMSVMAINLDSQNEAQYLHGLAQALKLDQRAVNHIHAELGVPALYA
ncbi:MAG: DUF533 domain-containing protein [Paracoccaceae bacterium]